MLAPGSACRVLLGSERAEGETLEGTIGLAPYEVLLVDVAGG